MGILKIADMGFARVFYNPAKPLADVDTVVVTLWYRAPELLLGSRHYTVAIDNWAVGCIFVELMTLEPLFHCRQDDTKSTSPYNYDQLDRIFCILGMPTEKDWPLLPYMPEYNTLQHEFNPNKYLSCSLQKYLDKFGLGTSMTSSRLIGLFKSLLIFDPTSRATAYQALNNQFFKEQPLPAT
ncbi:MAG: Serine/Threonine protein kinases, catalytic domain, partial [Paramarteilia canceri]